MGNIGNGPDWLNPVELHSTELAYSSIVTPLIKGTYNKSVLYGCHDILHYYLTRHGVCCYSG